MLVLSMHDLRITQMVSAGLAERVFQCSGGKSNRGDEIAALVNDRSNFTILLTCLCRLLFQKDATTTASHLCILHLDFCDNRLLALGNDFDFLHSFEFMFARSEQ